MKGYMLSVFFLIIIPLSCKASEGNFSRIGVSIGGVHIFGLYFERHSGDVSVRAQVGYLLRAVSFDIIAVRYFGSSKHRPYVGIGLLKHVEGRGLQGANLLCFPGGIDFDLSDKHYIGIEAIPAISLSAIKPGVGKRGDLYDYIFPLPAVAYKYKL